MLKKFPVTLIAFVLLGLSLFLSPTSQAQEQGKVHVVPLTKNVDRHLPNMLERAFDAAVADGAEAIILEITTTGGFVISAFDIGEVIIQTRIPVYAYVRTYALSAGGYIALACDELYMNAGSTYGSIMPVDGQGSAADEKTFSAVDKAVRSAAERNGRDPQIAAAMVRSEIVIPDVVAAGELLTLTAAEAFNLGYAEGIVSSREEVLAAVGMAGREVVVYQESRADSIARWLTDPIISPLLLSIGMAALVIELFTAGFGVAGSISLIAFVLYFGGHLIAGLAQWEHIAVFLLGIVFLAAEMFVSGFGLLGAIGLVSIVFSIILTADTVEAGLIRLGLSLLLATGMVALAFKVLKRTSLWQRLVLSASESREHGYVGPKDLSAHIGIEGVTATTLRPSGIVELPNGSRVDAITEGGYIAAGTAVVITGFSSGDVIVRPKTSE